MDVFPLFCSFFMFSFYVHIGFHSFSTTPTSIALSFFFSLISLPWWRESCVPETSVLPFVSPTEFTLFEVLSRVFFSENGKEIKGEMRTPQIPRKKRFSLLVSLQQQSNGSLSFSCWKTVLFHTDYWLKISRHLKKTNIVEPWPHQFLAYPCNTARVWKRTSYPYPD